MQSNFEAAVESSINKKKKEGWILIIFSFICMVPLLVFRGWVITEYWTWFVTPTFTTLPTLTIVPAIGISFFVTFLTFNPLITTKNYSSSKISLISFFMTGWFWVLGWLVSLFL